MDEAKEREAFQQWLHTKATGGPSTRMVFEAIAWEAWQGRATADAVSQRDRDLHSALFDTSESLKDIWRATAANGETCHFGNHATAVAWARKGGKVERATFPHLAAIPIPGKHTTPYGEQK